MDAGSPVLMISKATHTQRQNTAASFLQLLLLCQLPGAKL